MTTLPETGDGSPPEYSLLPPPLQSYPLPLAGTAPPLPLGRISPPSTASQSARQSPVAEETPAGSPGPPPARSSSRQYPLSRFFRRGPTEAAIMKKNQIAEEEKEQALMLKKDRERNEAREWAQAKLRHLLTQGISSADECTSVLQNCKEVCTEKDVDFPALLQEPIIDDLLPVYWAIVKQSEMQQGDGADPQALTLALVDFSQPLKSATVEDARNACVTVSDNAMFQQLRRRFKEFSFSCISAKDAMLLGGPEVEDKVVVEEPRGDPRAFVAHFELARFRLRMRVAKRVCVEPDVEHHFLHTPRGCVVGYLPGMENHSEAR
ncbi:hypothetical protein BC826DRAFT_1107065 [Russula brevipes]|nr:hypothetical protein BC826DRAFT_1107065 [Russula brevipes]